ncbi:hypothetical protein PMI07_000764 [Rhizobium sp. CF080]|uniref:hypothetical protein n=1 Tax=Rhizobium sp. (strain CF080) TaxID=1144310 RepID=UPI000271BD3B|nr:hypothetical protein [Rhizobium sp. CF080]EUB97188.1 hypothetical protein PMI07_000764 [Rhizobium sp. CF080]
MDKFVALLDAYSVFCALMIAPRSLVQLRGGKNVYELKKDAEARSYNTFWAFGYYGAFATAALSLIMKTFVM